MQKKIILLCLMSVMIEAQAQYSTFFRPRSISYNQTFSSTLTHYHSYHRSVVEPIGIWTVTPFYQRSLGNKKLAALLLPNDEHCISIREDGTGDVGSLWLGLISSPQTLFSSRVCLQPQRTSYGAYLQAHFDFESVLFGLWMNVGGAVMKTKHTLCLCERDLHNPGTLAGLATVTQALNNPAWNFGKWSPTTLSTSGFDDLVMKLGYDLFAHESSHVGLYALGGIPTGGRAKARYVFEPLVGSKFGAVGAGVQGDYLFFDNGRQSFLMMGDAQYHYEFPASERRSLDLCQQGHWSRFLQVVTPDAIVFSMPGINFFTKQVRVHPRSSLDVWLAFHGAFSCVHFECGYDFWYRQREKITWCDPALNKIGIYDLAGSCSGHPTSASRATISQAFIGNNRVPSDARFVALSATDLNLDSGASPCAMSSTFSLGLSLHPTIDSVTTVFGLFGTYELSHTRGALGNWACAAVAGISF